jgi:hypothetical protein
LFEQRREILLDGIPNDIPGYIEVVVNNLITDAAHWAPRQLRVSGDEFRSCLLNPNRRLANHRERAHNGILGLLVLLQCCQTLQTSGIADCPFDRAGDVFEIVFNSFRVLTAARPVATPCPGTCATKILASAQIHALR